MATYQEIINSMSQVDPAYQALADKLGVSLYLFLGILAIISVWALVWKGLALWKSCQKKQKVWFIVLLVVNTMGILEILYIYVFSKIGENSRTIEKVPVKKKKR